MSAQLHYDGRTYRLAVGADRAENLLRDIRASAAGGIVEVATDSGLLSIVVGPGIPVAVVVARN